jgi:hypothetical protein
MEDKIGGMYKAGALLLTATEAGASAEQGSLILTRAYCMCKAGALLLATTEAGASAEQGRR